MGRLKLKGAPPKNLKQIKKISKAVEKHVNVEVEEEEYAPEGWVWVETLEDLNGPLVILFESEQVIVIGEEGDAEVKDLEQPESEWEPTEVSQVVVGKFLVAGVFCLQSAYKRYLSSDQLGSITVTREAVGPSEKWSPEIGETGRVSFKSVFGRFLGVEDGRIRADGEEPVWFHVKCQAAVRWERERAARREAASKPVEEDFDLAEMRRQHEFKSKVQLEAAQREGRLREALLDARIKTKHDKYC